MTQMVLDEMDVEYFLHMKLGDAVKEVNRQFTQKYDNESELGKWLTTQNIKVQFITLNGVDRVKCVVYADMDEVQQVQYMLKFL